ncbi:tRNA1(Val) (adenine(37)-N6)-methyltransferase [Tuberibacillus calidus]|uniref:tRNA1(Val) (adenine(37)-N6)-methyltransferase n=1 Tax=Tuberibacillus calidus TaxID=340097 RepID=UPI0004250F91|nr:tRNA1(Val) (adenine(37)-N6)-methyltransferase [Tuberibacillus calidus]
MVDIGPEERIDFILDTDLKIIQSKDVFSFSLDAVLLAKFVYVPIQKGGMMDLCTGNGVIPLILSKRTKGPIYGIEIQPRLYDMARRSVALNHLEKRITLHCGDILDAVKTFGAGMFNVVTCNPPYFTREQAHIKNPNPHYAIARHELHMTLEDAIRVSSQLVRQKGKVAFVHRPERLAEILTLMETYRIAPKRLQFVHPRSGEPANMLLIEGVKDGRKGLKVLNPIFVYNDHGDYTKELKQLTYG